MSTEVAVSQNYLSGTSHEIVIPRSVQFWLILIFEIPSIACSLFVLYHLVFDRQLRRALHNHVFIILLFINLITKMLLEFVYACGVSEEFGADFVAYADYFAYHGDLLLPFVYAASLPELHQKIKKLVPCWRRRTHNVTPEAWPMQH
ncbi:unnamed protein product [Rotaria sp. Silwood1]|nr:unnamed protein product [Rotaria sp. Silwood1]